MTWSRDDFGHGKIFDAFCLDVRTLTVCQLLGFPLNHTKYKLLAGEQISQPR